MTLGDAGRVAAVFAGLFGGVLLVHFVLVLRTRAARRRYWADLQRWHSERRDRE